MYHRSTAAQARGISRPICVEPAMIDDDARKYLIFADA
jgi:hypothetical protein